MNILHIGLLSHFTEGMFYQDNVLSDMNAKDGNNVTFITDTNCYIEGKLTKVHEEDQVLTNGVRLIRVNYDKILNKFVTDKIQKVTKLRALLEEIQPDTILYHGVCGYELMDVAQYVKEHPNVLFYADSHEDFNNTARTRIAKLCYKYIHGYFLKKSIRYIRKIFYLTKETKEYLVDMYRIPDQLLEYYPLGGIIVSSEEQAERRQELISKYNLPNDAIILAHSGKMATEKRTAELIKAFKASASKNMILLIMGVFPEENKEQMLQEIASNERIIYLGWKNSSEMMEILPGCDLYCQPGTQSATLQMAMCCGCAMMVYPYVSHKDLLGSKGCIYVENEKDMESCIGNIKDGRINLKDIRDVSYRIAQKKLDYKMLARRICG